MEEKYGEVEEMNICDNLGDHLVGNVYVKVSVALYSHTTARSQVGVLVFFWYLNTISLCYFVVP